MAPSKYIRFGFDASISRHDLAETHLEQYRITISESNALGTMCSYSAINGSAACENSHLLKTWARKSVGFEGNAVTDCGALKMSFEPKDEVESSAAALNAGTGIDGLFVVHSLLLALSFIRLFVHSFINNSFLPSLSRCQLLTHRQNHTGPRRCFHRTFNGLAHACRLLRPPPHGTSRQYQTRSDGHRCVTRSCAGICIARDGAATK